MTTTAPQLPPSILAVIAPAVDAIRAEVRAAVIAVERIRLGRKGESAVRANGGEYRAGVDAILRYAVGDVVAAEDGPVGTCSCDSCDDTGCDGECSQCDDHSCDQCWSNGCDCECTVCHDGDFDVCDEQIHHPEGCRCELCR